MRGVILRWAPRLAALLALAALATASVAGVTQGRYAASGSGGDSARVAAWNVTAAPAESQAADADADGASAASYAFTISNGGEAAAECDVVVSLLSALPEGVSAELAVDGSTAAGPVLSDGGATLTFESAATLGPGKSAACALTFSDGRGADAAASVNGAAVSVSAWQAD